MSETLSPSHIKADILIVDDEVNTCAALKRAFDLLGYHAAVAHTGEQALAMLCVQDYDLMLLDLRMPGIDGVEVMKHVRKKQPDLLVIVLTAHATLNSAIAAVKAGAVDYLVKPQKIAQIQAAVETALNKRVSQLRRKRLISYIAEAAQALEKDDGKDILTPSIAGARFLHNRSDTILLDLDRRQLMFKKEDSDSNSGVASGIAEKSCVSLTANEFALISTLMRFPNKIFSNRELAVTALGYSSIDENSARMIIRPHITRLRKKIETDPANPAIIRTLRGQGYMFSSE